VVISDSTGCFLPGRSPHESPESSFIVLQWRLKLDWQTVQQEVLKHQSLGQMRTPQDASMLHPEQDTSMEDSVKGDIYISICLFNWAHFHFVIPVMITSVPFGKVSTERNFSCITSLPKTPD
jgi:hypothetical protein